MPPHQTAPLTTARRGGSEDIAMAAKNDFEFLLRLPSPPFLLGSRRATMTNVLKFHFRTSLQPHFTERFIEKVDFLSTTQRGPLSIPSPLLESLRLLIPVHLSTEFKSATLWLRQYKRNLRFQWNAPRRTLPLFKPNETLIYAIKPSNENNPMHHEEIHMNSPSKLSNSFQCVHILPFQMKTWFISVLFSIDHFCSTTFHWSEARWWSGNFLSSFTPSCTAGPNTRVSHFI